MIFAAILAGGTGSRMGNVNKPKQFLLLGEKPVIIHTIEKFYINNKIDKIIVLTPNKWINYTKDIIKKYIPQNDNIEVVEGGELRNDTILNGIKYIESIHNIENDDILITHDAVRPFVNYRIIEDNINCAKKNIVCDTVIPSTDTIVESEDNTIISNIPNRNFMYQGQTPQTFKINKFKEYYENLSNEDKELLTDACKIFYINNEKVHLVKGEVTNIKITYSYDLKLANAILKNETI